MTRMLPGPAGMDSPDLDELRPTAGQWAAWLAIAAARAANRPAPRGALTHALTLQEEPRWRFWWDRRHPTGTLTHRADVLTHPGGRTLVTACRYSQPYNAILYGVWLVGDVPIRDARRTYCLHCAATVPDQTPWPGDRPPTTPTPVSPGT